MMLLTGWEDYRSLPPNIPPDDTFPAPAAITIPIICIWLAVRHQPNHIVRTHAIPFDNLLTCFASATVVREAPPRNIPLLFLKASWQALTPSLTQANTHLSFNFHCISAPNGSRAISPWALGPRTLSLRTLSPKYFKSQGHEGQDLRSTGPQVPGP